MFHIFTQITRVPSRPKQCLQHISRSFCYKIVERKAAASTDQTFNSKPRRKKTPTKEYKFDFKAKCVRPARDRGRSLEIIKALPADSKDITEEMLIETYDKLSAGPINDEALLHANFDTFIDATECILLKLSVSQVLHIFKQTARAQIPMFDELNEIIVKDILVKKDLLRHITFITVDDIIDVDFALRKYYAREWKISKLFEEFRQATRAAFVAKVNEELVENLSHKKLMRIMRYLGNNRSLVQYVDTSSLSKQLLLEDDQEFQDSDVVFTIVTLARFPKLDEHSKQLLTKMYRIWCGNEQDIESVKGILKLLCTKKPENTDLSHFHDPLFFQRCTQIAIEKKDMRSAFAVLDAYNELNFASTQLIDFVSIAFNKTYWNNKHVFVEVDDYGIFCTACEKANYKPTNWESNVVPAIKRAKLQESNFFKQVDLALTLHKLGIQHAAFIENFFNSAQLTHWHKNNKKLAEVHKAYSIGTPLEVAEPKTQKNVTPYMSWLALDLEKFIGANKVLNNVIVSDDLTVPLVLKVNTETGNFLDMKERTERQNLICNKNELMYESV
ncbi:uncharacterized protein LOC129574678 isoform X2 [Sitodiplosis mosellana]|uniref:uncharacterized protein LOC129574678 isoform X2 n=1 Tax=Sitodiplosis mosellana TaxID=263140 RepID=UPI0024442E6D|nr:uncharacterized protein LOC129574678 isoform X2 [Sitodiplosis mosellana]